ncbi:hypothetical protein [Streptomyces sp. NPDC059455]|uniref:hypothetical protein n=1 Tax=Streptomyces sp. NPDC059455 TaxID=3346837 RepID=UPI0036AE9267
MAAETETKTGIKNADEIITLALAYGLTVTVETTDRETLTSHLVRFAIPVPVAYAGTELGRAIAGDTLTMLWTKSTRKGARGRLEDATVWSATDSRKVRTVRLLTAGVEHMGRDAQKYARDAAPLPEDVVDAPHAVFVDGRQVHKGIPAARVRMIVSNRRFAGRLVHQDDENAICSDSRRYVPVQPTPAEETPAPADERKHVRTVDGGTPEIIPTRDALAEINTAMMEGKHDVREMSAARSSARIVYKDPARGTVKLRPATAEGLSPRRPRPAAEVLAADPIPAGASVLEGMPGRKITREELRTPGDVLIHTDYVVQLRNSGAWILPNHDDHADITRGSVAIVLRRMLDDAPGRARTTLDTDGTVYVSNGRQAVRYIPAARIADRSADFCPGCGTPYATNGDGPCAQVHAAEQRAADADRIRAQAALETRAYNVRLEAQQLATNQVIEERARESLAAVLHQAAGEGKAGFVFHTNHLAVRLRGVNSYGEEWPLLTEALQLHLEHYGWFVEPAQCHGVRITPGGDVAEIVREGQRRSVDTAHAQAVAELAQV